MDINTDDEIDREFPEYMKENYLHIDLWDGESLLYLGSSSVQLKPALRQGKTGISFEDDVDVVYEDVSTKLGNNSSPRSVK